jgi:hypothetical protein
MTTGYATSFKELRVYQKAKEVSRSVYEDPSEYFAAED